VPSFDEFVAQLAPVLGLVPGDLAPYRRLGVEVPLDELSLSQLLVSIQELNEDFDLPDQIDLEDVTVADLYHFATVMRPGAPRERQDRIVIIAEPSDIPMQGRYCGLVPFSRDFTEELFQLASANLIPWQWHAPETPEAFQESLWRGVLVQYAVQDLRTGRSVGFLRADNANLFFGFAYLTMMIHPHYRMKAWPLEGALLFGNYLFTKFNLEHLYAETTESYLKQFASGIGTAFEVEGRQRDRVVINGRREDLYILTFSRERWLAEGKPAVDRMVDRLRMRAVS
jgi:hypothetical protein